MMAREDYVKALRRLLSGDPKQTREANRALYGALVRQDADRSDKIEEKAARRDADLALAEAVNKPGR